MSYEDELPCGGFEQQDKQIQNDLKKLSLGQQLEEKKLCQPCGKNTCDIQCVKVDQQIVMISDKKNNTKVPLCKKCSSHQSVLLHKNQPICKDCLLKNIQYKCRLSLQNKIKIKKNQSALICFSGGLNSICLVNLICSLKKRYQKNPLFDKIACIHILQQNSIPKNYVKQFTESTGFQLIVIRIQQIFENQQIVKKYQNVKKIFNMFKDSANTSDLLEIFRDRLIRTYARAHNYTHIFKGNNTEKLAIQIFQKFVKGKGGNVTDMTIYDGTNFAYPLREHIQKQLQYYFYSQKLSHLSLKAQEDDFSNVATYPINNYLQTFIMKLQSMYSHTAPAIVRTSEKIQSNLINQFLCDWCQEKCVYQQNKVQRKLCLRCWRIIEAAKPQINWNLFPNWMRIKQFKQ